MEHMSRSGWFIRFLSRSIVRRKGRVAVAALSVMIAVGIIVSALGISLGIRGKLGSELKAYGANVMLSKRGGYIDVNESLRSALTVDNGIEHYILHLYTGVQISDPGGKLAPISVEMMGMELADSGLKIQGEFPQDDFDILAGADLRDAMGLSAGDTLRADLGDGIIAMRVTGFLESGGAQDRVLIMSLPQVQSLTHMQGKASAALLRVDTSRLDEIVAMLSNQLPGIEVKTLTQVARAEESFLAKIELLMALVAVVVLIASSISVSSTMSATVLERLKEIGLMKAIGGTRAEIGAFFMAEGVIIGLIGGVLGYVLGFVAAQAVSKGAFGSYIPVPIYLLVGGVIVGTLLSVGASLWPLLGALKYKPSVILRGE